MGTGGRRGGAPGDEPGFAKGQCQEGSELLSSPVVTSRRDKTVQETAHTARGWDTVVGVLEGTGSLGMGAACTRLPVPHAAAGPDGPHFSFFRSRKFSSSM